MTLFRSSKAGRASIAALTLAVLAAAHPGAAAQDVGSGGAALGPLGVSSNLQWQSQYDDNVLRSAGRPEADVISTFGGHTDISTRLRRLGVTASGSADWMQFDRLASERGANVGTTLRLDFLLNRITPYVIGSYRNTRQRLNPEIDARPRQRGSTVELGSSVRLTDKTTVNVSAERTFVAYDANATAEAVNLNAALGRASDELTVSLVEAITPVTAVSVTGDLTRDRFDSTSARNSDHVRVTAGFQSSGLIDGSVRAGLRLLKPQDPNLPETRGFYLSAATRMTVLNRVQVGLDASRDVAPSYRQIAYYEFYRYGLSLSYAMRPSLHIGAQVDRRESDYNGAVWDGGAGVLGVDREWQYGASVGYELGHSLGINVAGLYSTRASETASRRFDALNMSAGVTYGF